MEPRSEPCRPPEKISDRPIFGSRRLASILHPASLSFALLGLLITTFAASALYHSEKEALGNQFNAGIADIHETLRESLVSCEEAIRAGMILTKFSDRVQRDEWDAHVDELRLRGRVPAILGIGYAAFIPLDKSGEFITLAHDSGYGEVKIHPGNEAPFCAPVLHYQSTHGVASDGITGFDLMSRVDTGLALARARDTGLSSQSPVTPDHPLTGETEASSFLICRPVYARGAKLETVADRRAAIRGFVFCPVDLKVLLGSMVSRVPADVGIQVIDTAVDGATLPLFATAGENISSAFRSSIDFHAGGQVWKINAFSLSGFENWLARLSSLAIALAGVAITLFGMMILADSKSRQEKATRVAESMADSLREREAEVRKLNAGLEKTVAERTASLREANEELRSFSYTISHDLRAPVRHIQALASFVEEDHAIDMDGTSRDYISRIGAAATTMQKLIEDILHLATCAEAGFHPEAVDLSMLAGQVTGEVRSQYPDREVIVRIDEGLAASCDPSVARTTLQNLIENAFKFTAMREIASVSIGRVAGDGDAVFFVKDDGIGFDVSLAESAFKLFKRLHRQSDYPGTGVGLATVRKLIRRHGGEIWADSAEGTGSTFFFTFNHVPGSHEKAHHLAAGYAVSQPRVKRPVNGEAPAVASRDSQEWAKLGAGDDDIVTLAR